MDMKMAVQNLGSYNRGGLIFEWVEIPASEEEVQNAINRVLEKGKEHDEEYYVADFSDRTGILREICGGGYYPSPQRVNEVAGILDSYDETVVRAIWEELSGDTDYFLEVLQAKDYICFKDIDNNQQLGEKLMEQGYIPKPETLPMKYVDFEQIGKEAGYSFYKFDGESIAIRLTD